MSKRDDPYTQLHCTSCHECTHAACITCGACLPKWHRRDRLHCSSSCRVRAHVDRRQWATERAIWEAEHPEEAREQAEAREQRIQAINSLEIAIGPDGASHRNRRQDYAEHCAKRIYESETKTFANCQKTFGPGGDVIYRRRDYKWAITTPVLPYCKEHRCTQQDGHHNRDCPEGTHYPSCWCDDNKWEDPQSCEGCARLLSHPKYAPWRYTYLHYGAAYERKSRSFCSETCRRLAFRVERKAKRLAERDNEKTCAICKATFKGRRADAMYCSAGCRQKAYRQTLDGASQ